jgi:tRNA-specific 2-thiouridylase
MSRVVLAMSGGVDSSVAAALLLEQGHEVIGLFMRHGQQAETACETSASETVGNLPGRSLLLPLGEGRSEGRRGRGATAVAPPASLPIVTAPLVGTAHPTHKQGCCTASDAADARRVADKLDVPFYALNFEAEFGRIIDYFVEEYTAGRTPNPCVVCNNWLKFGSLCDYADSVGAEFIATGHYARLVQCSHLAPRDAPLAEREGYTGLCRGLDPGKDQSYVLFGIRREILPRLMFPVGGYRKDEIRERARRLGLRVADKKDSQEICFVTSGNYADFVRRRRGNLDLSGELVTTDGEVVGRHQGIENFTVGQRKGLGVAMGERYFVVRIEPETRRVVIGRRDELARREFTAARANWLIDEPTGPLRCEVKIRYLSQPVAGTVEPLGDGRLRFTLDEPKHGVAPGQAAVCYAGDRVLGGGWIE